MFVSFYELTIIIHSYSIHICICVQKQQTIDASNAAAFMTPPSPIHTEYDEDVDYECINARFVFFTI